ncbi:MAG: DUF3662 and FHA domain-containing protein [Coriobacteriia bacterium]|nr:DUF3662 and FHA domain-containing protein [Coriobacteriia bacterium]
MGFFSRFENKVEDTFDSIGDKMFDSPISPVQIAKKAEKQMRRNKMVGAGKQYAPTLYTVLVNRQDDERLFGYYSTLAGETETYLEAKANDAGFVMDGHPLVRFIVDEDLKHGKFDVIAETVASAIIEQLRAEEMQRYGINNQQVSQAQPQPQPQPQPQIQVESAFAPEPQPAPQPAPAPEPTPAPAAAPTAVFAAQNNQAPVNNNVPNAQLQDMTSGQVYTLNSATVVIGRENTCNIVLSDVNTSRQHAQILFNNGMWMLNDLGSTNGTFVNNQQITSRQLNPGDVITIGVTNLKFN